MPPLFQRLNNPRPRVAVIRALQLGDLLCAMPAIRSLRNALPGAEITLVSLPWARELVARYPEYLDAFVEFPGWPGIPETPFEATRWQAFQAGMAGSPYDLVIQLHGSGSHINDFARAIPARWHAGFVESAHEQCDDWLLYPQQLPEIHRHLRFMEYLGGNPADARLEFPLTPDDEKSLGELPDARDLLDQDYVCIHPGARWPSRRWPAERFAEVATALCHDGWKIVLTGSPAERPLAADVRSRLQIPHLDLCGKTTLGMLGVVLRNARLLVSNDTGVAHVAAGLGTPSVVIVMGSDPARWAPLDRARHRVVLAAADCRPCDHFVCPVGHHCAHDLATTMVLKAAREQLLAAHLVPNRPALTEDLSCAHSVC